MTKRYANAKDVLPPELLEKVKKHYTGPLYIPRERNAAETRELVLKLARSNTPSITIARIVGLSRRRVNQILEGKRKIEYVWDE
jgi:hypothetical protein